MSEQTNLLRQIAEESVVSGLDEASLLRKCLVLASRLRKAFLRHQSRDCCNGYQQVHGVCPIQLATGKQKHD